MTPQQAQPLDPTRVRPGLVSPLVLIGGTVLMMAFMSHHPTVSSEGLDERINEVAREARLNGIVHGSLIAIVIAMYTGLFELSRVLGWRRGPVRVATVSYTAGMIWLTGAALVSGFAVPALTVSYVGRPLAELELLPPVMNLAWQMNQTLAGAGSIAFSIGIASWSIVLLTRGRAAALIGVLGIAVGVTTLALLLLGELTLHKQGMSAVLLGEGVWMVAVASWMLWLRRLREPSPSGVL